MTSDKTKKLSKRKILPKTLSDRDQILKFLDPETYGFPKFLDSKTYGFKFKYKEKAAYEELQLQLKEKGFTIIDKFICLTEYNLFPETNDCDIAIDVKGSGNIFHNRFSNITLSGIQLDPHKTGEPIVRLKFIFL